MLMEKADSTWLAKQMGHKVRACCARYMPAGLIKDNKMLKGKGKVKFVGGLWDGKSLDEFDTRMMHDSVQVFSGIWAKKLPDGNIGLIKSKRYGSDWLFCQNHQYQRNGKDDNGYFVYEFEKEIDNHRCEAVTHKGYQC